MGLNVYYREDHCTFMYKNKMHSVVIIKKDDSDKIGTIRDNHNRIVRGEKRKGIVRFLEEEINTTKGITIQGMLDKKDCLLYVHSVDGDIHISWEVQKKILVFEICSGRMQKVLKMLECDCAIYGSWNSIYPSIGLFYFDGKEDYLNAIKDVDWIMNKEYTVRCKDKEIEEAQEDAQNEKEIKEEEYQNKVNNE